ncbi:ComEC family competence protein [Thalassococcus sp. CAU 1522]|uniref:ComEC family competence protein n=1 Tax=Thalassococcus arenae TaxID=2851652 RepID=A0ABS6NAV1_9RHOB|nr:ComEC/Rec2 family competence protein [Thalassococcus arenae]MBV2361151.1 ComEC family competence protein [Thalassococcus arenae]
MGTALRALAAILPDQRGFLFPWAPVCLACGIGFYFALRVEPPVAALWLAALSGAALVGLGLRANAVAGPLLIAAGLVAAGLALAGARSHTVAGPLLDFRYYGPIQGRVVGIDRSASDAVRLTLDWVVLDRMAPADTPARVRVALHGQQGYADPAPGATVILTGHLSAPGGAAEPGGFDFRRHAWFLRLGAVGYTRTPVLLLEPPQGGQWVFRARMWLSERVKRTLPGETGAFAAAVMTGDRSGMGQATLDQLRDTNLAHLIAISGLHMGLLAGTVFAALRLGLLLIPAVRLTWPVKKLAAAGALLAAAGYLALSGGNVATERAFVMAAVALLAVMLDRRALSLRAVALAALIILSLRPEALLGPGFQMSFAATTALVAVFEALSRADGLQRAPRWLRPVLSLVISSAVAGAATAPIAMAHFNQVAHYGLLANLVSVPVMGAVVVPMAVLSAVLLPLGLDWIALWIMGLGLDWILAVAHHVAQWDGAVGAVVAPGPAVLPLIAAAGLIAAIWRGRGRAAAALPLAVAAGLWMSAERPALLVAEDGGLVGILTPEGRALSRDRGSGFVAGIWLENDGQGGDQAGAAARWPGQNADRIARASLGGVEIVHLQGKRAAAAFAGCTPGAIVVATVDLPAMTGCTVFDPKTLRATGAVAFWDNKGALRFDSVTARSGQRLWHGAGPAPLRLAKAQ